MPRVDYNTHTIVSRIYNDLLEQLMRGQTELTISEGKLAKRFGTSKTPVREALQRLAADGIVAANPKRGWHVLMPSLRELRDLFAVSAVLQGYAAYQAALNAAPTEVEQLTHLAEASIDLNDLRSYREYTWRNYQFHILISKASHNAVLESHIRSIWSRIQLVLIDVNVWSPPDIFQNGRKQVVRCLARQDAIGAKTAMERQIELTMQYLLAPPSDNGNHLENPEALTKDSKIIRL